MDLINHVVTEITHYIIFAFNVFAVILITWGVFEGMFSIIQKSIGVKTKVNHWRNFVLKLIAALEFLLAVDILHTIISPHWQSMVQVAFIVFIRAVLTFILDREVKENTFNM